MLGIAKAMIIAHLAFALTTASHTYFTADIPVRWTTLLDATPLNSLREAAGSLANPFDADGGVLSGLTGPFGVIADIVDTIVGLCTFDYSILAELEQGGGLPALFPEIVAIVGAFACIALFYHAMRFIFQSGLLSSTAGLLLVGGAGITGIVSKLIDGL